MSEPVVYLFQGNFLVLPETGDVLAGVDKSLVTGAFGELDFYAAPAIDGSASLSGFLLNEDAAIPALWKTFSMREAVVLMSADQTGMPGTSGCGSSLLRLYHVLQWREDSRFCGSCGSPNGDSPDELARLCPHCGRLEYPRISPAIITLVINDRGEALLAHNNKFKGNVYSLVAGFTEAGENLETTVAREIREEVAIEVKDIRYLASQSWPFPNSLMVGFTARYAGGEVKGDGVEIADARWFSRESVRAGVPELPAFGSVSRYIIEKWLNNEL
jgi:NAD+ diphosphatase